MIVEARGLSFGYGSDAGAGTVLRGVDLRLEPGVTAVIGPNAAGKSTLLRCLAGLLRPAGEVRIDGRAAAARELAGTVSFLPQESAAGAALTVFEAVLLGLLTNLGWTVGEDAAAAVGEMLEEVGIADLAGRHITELSGGQLQMVFIAQALVRKPPVLLMDEPTNSLDLRHQFETLELIAAMTSARGLTTVVALHDLGLAARFARRICVLHGGRIRAEGTPAEVLTPEMLAEVYGVEARVVTSETGCPWVVPVGVKQLRRR